MAQVESKVDKEKLNQAGLGSYNTQITIVDIDETKYDILWKDIPDDIPNAIDDDPDLKSPTGKHPITWFNSFCVYYADKERKGKNIPIQTGEVTYKVTLAMPPGTKRLCLYYGGKPQKQTYTTDKVTKTISFTLNVGDPPVGFYP